MLPAARILLLVIVASSRAPMLPSTPCHASAPTSAADLTRERNLLVESDAACKVSDYDTARAKAAEAVTALLARPSVEQDAAWLGLLEIAGRSARVAQDARTANTAYRRVFDIRFATLPDNHPELQTARGNLASTMAELGDLAGARVLEEKVLEVRLRTLPGDHPDLQRARAHLAITIAALGDLLGARTLEEQVLEVRQRTLPDDHPGVQAARNNLAVTIQALGDFAGARALVEKVLEVYSRTLPDDHPDLQAARENLALTIEALGQLAAARVLKEKVLEVRLRTLPEDHPDLQRARQNLAITVAALGDLSGARTLFEKVLEVNSRTLPDDHPDVQSARNNLAVTIEALGDFSGARTLFERVLEVNSRTLPDDHPELQRARQNLAVTIEALGDLEGARMLEEKVLEVRSRTLPDDHPDLQKARQNLAVTIAALGDLPGARTLLEKVLEVRSRTLPDDHPELQRARENLAVTIEELGDLAGARALEEKALEVNSRTLPDDHPNLQAARLVLAKTIARQSARVSRAPATESERAAERERCAELMGALCRAQVRAAREVILGSPGREAEERCSHLAKQLHEVLSFASGYGVFEPLSELEAPSFVLAETTRGAAIVSAQLSRRAASAPKYGELREALRHASDELAGLAQSGATSAAFDRARTKRESVERELALLARELSGGKQSGVELDVDSLAARLDEHEAAVGYCRFKKAAVKVVDELDVPVRLISVDSLCAFVVRSSNAIAQPDSSRAPVLTRVDLGPIAPIEDAARGWRDAIGVGLERGAAARDAEIDTVEARGSKLRELVFDPLLAALRGTDQVVVVLDDVLHLVPLDALPLANSNDLVGDRWRIETRATLTELLTDSPEPTGTALVALGGASFNTSPRALSAEESLSIEEEKPIHVAALLRGTAWERGFAPLTHTAEEARGVGALYTEIFEETRPALVLEKSKASREALEDLAPKARFVHIATHGWFAPESIKSWSDPQPLDEKTGLGSRMSGAEQVRGMSPMLLCGLALAGANLSENALGRAPGLVTADELSTLDLSNCELVVLSACDTNIGERRAGQGVASLQSALQMAGTRSVITSLWKVPDEATKELMLDFYRRLWMEKKPKGQALWEAKKKLREAKDESGNRKYATRDWAAWVLTGDPD